MKRVLSIAVIACALAVPVFAAPKMDIKNGCWSDQNGENYRFGICGVFDKDNRNSCNGVDIFKNGKQSGQVTKYKANQPFQFKNSETNKLETFYCCQNPESKEFFFNAGSAAKKETKRVELQDGYCEYNATFNHCGIETSQPCNRVTKCNDGFELRGGKCIADDASQQINNNIVTPINSGSDLVKGRALCQRTGGTWSVDACKCRTGYTWDDDKGCQKAVATTQPYNPNLNDGQNNPDLTGKLNTNLSKNRTLCSRTGGTWSVDACKCRTGYTWDDDKGCQKAAIATQPYNPNLNDGQNTDANIDKKTTKGQINVVQSVEIDLENGCWNNKNIDFGMCGDVRETCNGVNITNDAKSIGKYNVNGFFRNNGKTYYCCQNPETKKFFFRTGSGAKSKIVRVQLQNGYCEYRTVTDVCGFETSASQEPCTTPTKCNSGYMLKNGECVQLAKKTNS